MINERLVWYLETNNINTEFQGGFRHQRRTNAHLVRLETFIREAFTKKEHVVAVFFDLEKAYDTTWKYGIMNDLHEIGLKIQKWATENGFKFCRSKTVCMHFCHLRKAHNDPVQTLDGTPIPVVEENKFQGVIFDRKLSVIPHIKQLKAKCQKAFNLQ